MESAQVVGLEEKTFLAFCGPPCGAQDVEWLRFAARFAHHSGALASQLLHGLTAEVAAIPQRILKQPKTPMPAQGDKVPREPLGAQSNFS